MKKIILMVAVSVMVAVGANAQNGFDKGDWTLGASLTDMGFNHSFGKGTLSNTHFDLGVYGGHFFTDKLAVNARLGFDVLKVKGLDASADFTFGVAARYYPLCNLFASAGYIGTATGGSLASNVSIEVGYDLFLSEKVYFEPIVYYSTRLDTKVSGVGLSLGVGVKF